MKLKKRKRTVKDKICFRGCRLFLLVRVGLLGRIVVVAGAGGKGCSEQQASEEVKQFLHRRLVFLSSTLYCFLYRVVAGVIGFP